MFRKSILIFILILLTGIKGWAQVNLSVSQISLTKWDSHYGILYKQVPGVNLGATSFEIMDSNRVAFLCNSTDEIVITDKRDAGVIRKFSVAFSPRDFVYSNGYFFVLTENQVIQYDDSGNEIKTFSFPARYLGVERLTRINGDTYLLHPNGNCLMIESNGYSVNTQEEEGWITDAGNFVITKIAGNNFYYVKVKTNNGNNYESAYTTTNNIAGVFVVGSTKNRIVLDVQTFLSEDPISVERFIVEIELSNYGLGAIVAQTKVPDCYYVLSNKDFLVLQDGTIYNMITAPQGTFVFALSEISTLQKSAVIQGYPSYINEIKYHFNNNLIKMEEK